MSLTISLLAREARHSRPRVDGGSAVSVEVSHRWRAAGRSGSVRGPLPLPRAFPAGALPARVWDSRRNGALLTTSAVPT